MIGHVLFRDIEFCKFFKNFSLDFDIDSVIEFSRILILILNFLYLFKKIDICFEILDTFQKS